MVIHKMYKHAQGRCPQAVSLWKRCR